MVAAGDHYGKRTNGNRDADLFFDGNQLFIACSRALWPFSEGTMMLHAATSRAGGVLALSRIQSGSILSPNSPGWMRQQ